MKQFYFSGFLLTALLLVSHSAFSDNQLWNQTQKKTDPSSVTAEIEEADIDQDDFMKDRKAIAASSAASNTARIKTAEGVPVTSPTGNPINAAAAARDKRMAEEARKSDPAVGSNSSSSSSSKSGSKSQPGMFFYKSET